MKDTRKIRTVICGLIFICLFIAVNLYCNILTNRIDTLTKEKESISITLEDTKTELIAITDQLYLTKNGLAQTTEELTKTSEELVQTVEKLTKTNKELNSTKKALNKTKSDLSKTKKELAEAKKKIDTLSKKNTKTQSSSVKKTTAIDKTKNYPVATQAWKLMKSYGWSDIACAGIMGNLMAETGGGTLKLNWERSSSSGLGLVQWIGGRRNSIVKRYGATPTIKQQIQFMHDELYGTNGVRRQVSKSQLNAILKAKTPEDAAYAFASYYERCATQYRNIRRTYARKAYNYFTN